MRSRAVRGLAVLGIVLGVSIVPLHRVAACDCALTDLPEAIREAEVAIIGTLAGAAAPPLRPGVVAEPTEHVWNVERARDPMSAITISIAAWPDDGANCGITFGADERWLILAYQGEGGLETNGCMHNTRLSDAAAEDLEAIDALVATSVAPGSVTESASEVPAPLLVAVGALAVVAVISFLAFRRSGPGSPS